MKKRITIVILVIALVLMFAIPAFAAAKVPIANLSFAINGTTASCKLTVSDMGKYINATMELWQGSTFITSWSASGYSVVGLSETYTVMSGVTYTLKGYGTSGGVSFTVPDITRP